MHGTDARLHARGEADIDGVNHPFARALRTLLRLPAPGTHQALGFTIERHGMREIWTRDFAHVRMRSVLTRAGDLLCERLGPIAFRFKLRGSHSTIHWELRSMRFLGIPLPRWMCGQVSSLCAAESGRYTFDVDVHMALIGKLVAYRGWLEPTDG